jgi:rhodanese-related sulfurtransferase
MTATATAAIGVDGLLAAARARLRRLTPHEAAVAVARGALLVDIRPHAQRVVEGEVPGALVVERNVLEWRFDPTGTHRVPQAAPDLQVVVLCSEGYTSSLAAAALHDVGVPRATDVVGGITAWRAAGLPVVAGGTPAGGTSPATSPARRTGR